MMGGDISIKSKIGFGTNMIVVFPSETCPEVSVIDVDHSKDSLSPMLAGKKCLIVDDIPENTYILMQLLEKNGLVVISKNSSKEALEEYSITRDIDLVITDLRMPGMSGQSLILEIRKLESIQQRRRIPILILTAETSPNEKITCLSSIGADDYLLKPIKLIELMKAVEKALKKKKSNTSIPKNIMIVDDEVISRKFISAIIKQNANHNVNDFGCIADAIKEFGVNGNKYDLIFLDSMLPDGSGQDFMYQYRKIIIEKGIKKVPVVSISGNSMHSQQEMYAGYQMYAFLEKPVSKVQLQEVLKSIE